jgi:hypothetical protein
MMREAGIEWVRLGTPVPFEDRIRGELTERYRRYREHLAGWREDGFRIMGVSSGPGVKRWEPDGRGGLHMVWHRRLPEWFGELGSRRCLDTYGKMCAFLAEDLGGLVEVWQIANELHWHQFAGPLSPPEACEFILAGARGLKSGDPDLIVGHNGGTSPNSYFLWGRLFADHEGPLDYCGVDKYFGSWHPGGPEDWVPTIEELHELTGAPVLVNEWGYASAGGLKTAEDHEKGRITCDCHRWPHEWDGGHTPEVQGKFVERSFEAFARVRDKMLGQFYFRWSDQETCWQCGEPDCPAETAWGMVDLAGKPKPAYDAYREGVRKLRDA